MVDFPTTLIIGLGGVGSQITADIYSKFLASHPSDLEKRNLFCLCLDTDAGDIAKRKKILPNNCVIKTSADVNMTVGDYLNTIRDKSTALDWFDTRSEHVINMTLNKGAGQIRMASRLAYMAAMGEEKLRAIDNAISSLLTVEPARHDGNNISVHIICSLAGGTGAGSFLQTAYYVKDIMRNDYHISAPEITGYFVLADVLVYDKQVGFNKTQTENARSNTYACMKELNAFLHAKKVQVLKPIQFEYKFGQEDLHLPHAVPYNMCYLIDFTSREGQNLNNKEQYYDQVRDYVYLNVFTPIGATIRSRLINDIRQTVERDGEGAFSAIGVSKMVYPLDDILSYFATRKVVDNLSASWVVLDDIYKEALKAYNEKLNNGEKAEEPSIEDIFCFNVQEFATHGSGLEKTIFTSIYNSTGILDEEGIRTGEKSQCYLNAVEEHVTGIVESNDKFNELYTKTCTEMDSFLTEDEETNDVDCIREREEYLEKFKKFAKSFVEKVSTSAIKDCFLASASEENRISPDARHSRHQLNTYILEKGHEMHPIAVRYFLYDTKKRMENTIAELKPLSEDLLKQIDEMYQLNFNVIDDKNDADDEHKETAIEKMSIVYSRNKAFYKRIWHGLLGKKPVRECKEDYLRYSGIQSENIKSYANTQLKLLVFEGLLTQIERLIDESERFFNRLPETLQSLQKKEQSLLTRHDDNLEPSIIYVLAQSRYKKLIYEEEISTTDTVFFPNDLSAQIYRNMFDATHRALTHARKTVELSEKEKEVIQKAQLTADMEVFNAVLKSQEDSLRENCRYARMNVIGALREEAERTISYDLPEAERNDRIHAYMKERFDHLKQMSVTLGADHIDTDINRPINSWGIHPDCIDTNVLRPQERADFFGDTDIATTPLTAATQEVSSLFSPYEIIRADSTNQLEILQNFRAFVNTPTNALSQGNTGVYYKAYMDVIGRIIAGGKAYSPHLDKHWHLPSILPNIGQTMDDTLKDLYAALCYGILFGRLTIKSPEGMGGDFWYCISDVSNYVTDLAGGKIGVKGKSVAMALNNLFESGLANHPEIVTRLLQYADKQWQAAKEHWQNTEEPSLDKMKNQPIVRKIKEFTFSKLYSAQSWANPKYNFFLLANDQAQVKMIAQSMSVLKPFLLNDLILRLVEVFGASENTAALCKYLFNTSIPDDSLKAEALALLEAADEKGLF